MDAINKELLFEGKRLQSEGAQRILSLESSPKNTSGSISGIKIVKSDFGLLAPSPSGEPVFKVSRRIPLEEGQGYGWFVEIKTSKPKIKWREEFVLPAKPATWDTQGSTAQYFLSKDGRTLITEREVTPVNGIISNTWEVAAGDPKGLYIMRVYIEGKLIQVFEFVAE